MAPKRRKQKTTSIRRSLGGEQLHNLRLAQGRVGKWCATQIGVHNTLWSMWETGVRTPSDEHVAKIAALFAVPLTALDALAAGK